jgi:hypothetical protein
VSLLAVRLLIRARAAQAVQFSINASFLADPCGFLERYISSYCDPKNSAQLQFAAAQSLSARAMFLQTRMRCEDLMFELIDIKIEQFLSLTSTFNFLPTAVNQNPSDYIDVRCATTRCLPSCFASAECLPHALFFFLLSFYMCVCVFSFDFFSILSFS